MCLFQPCKGCLPNRTFIMAVLSGHWKQPSNLVSESQQMLVLLIWSRFWVCQRLPSWSDARSTCVKYAVFMAVRRGSFNLQWLQPVWLVQFLLPLVMGIYFSIIGFVLGVRVDARHDWLAFLHHLGSGEAIACNSRCEWRIHPGAVSKWMIFPWILLQWYRNSDFVRASVDSKDVFAISNSVHLRYSTL